MPNLTTLSDMARNHGLDFKANSIYDPTNDTAYGANGEKVGTIHGALVDDTTGRIRYLIVDVGGWFSSKTVLVPVGLARFDNDAVYFDSLTKDQVKGMGEYRHGMEISEDFQIENERAITGVAPVASATTGKSAFDYRDNDTTNTMFSTPQKLQLLEERLVVNKERERVGEVEIGKRVETRQENVAVTLARDEVVIERRPVTDARPVDGNVTLGAADETIRVDLEADRAEVRKQAYVTEEVEVSKRQESDTKTFTETVGREVLEVEKTGEARIAGNAGVTDNAKVTDGSKR
jgi:uncharacterized protein (TIGR02271 family)